MFVLYYLLMNSRVYELTEKLWNYHRLNHQLEKSDAILVLCSHDKKVAERGAQLFIDGWAPLLIFSGGLGSITSNLWRKPEADQFAEIAFKMGVPNQNVLIENQSANTGENILFTKRLLDEKEINVEKFLLVQKPYMERRSYATFKKLWAEKSVLVTSPQLTFDEYFQNYVNSKLSVDDVINIIVGDLQRIKLYAEKGFQIQQEIPQNVRAAYEELVESGYDKRLVK